MWHVPKLIGEHQVFTVALSILERVAHLSIVRGWIWIWLVAFELGVFSFLRSSLPLWMLDALDRITKRAFTNALVCIPAVPVFFLADERILEFLRWLWNWREHVVPSSLVEHPLPPLVHREVVDYENCMREAHND